MTDNTLIFFYITKHNLHNLSSTNISCINYIPSVTDNIFFGLRIDIISNIIHTKDMHPEINNILK